MLYVCIDANTHKQSMSCMLYIYLHCVLVVIYVSDKQSDIACIVNRAAVFPIRDCVPIYVM